MNNVFRISILNELLPEQFSPLSFFVQKYQLLVASKKKKKYYLTSTDTP